MTCRVQHRRPVHTLARTLHRARAAHAPTWMEAASGINSARCPCVVHWDARLTAADGAQPTRSHPRASTAELGPRACGSPRPRISHSPRQPLCGDDHLGKPCACHPSHTSLRMGRPRSSACCSPAEVHCRTLSNCTHMHADVHMHALVVTSERDDDDLHSQ